MYVYIYIYVCVCVFMCRETPPTGLKTSGKIPLGTRTTPLNFTIMIESVPPKSGILALRPVSLQKLWISEGLTRT